MKAEDLADTREEFKKSRIVLSTDCFDILQSGHAVFFNQCKQFGDLLIVGVGRDKTVSQLKGADRPVNPETNRLYLVAAMEDVDFAVLNQMDPIDLKLDFVELLEKLRPEVFVVNDDDNAIDVKKKICNRLGIEMRLVSRDVPDELIPTSTTNIINKINFSLKAPLRIDFAGGWTDVPYIMDGEKGYVSNVAIRPLIEYKGGNFNFSGYPRGSGLSTSTAVKLLEMLNAKSYNAESKTLSGIGEDLFNLENKELQWFIGRQDQYAIVFGGFNCFEFGADYAKPLPLKISAKYLERLREHIILIHTGESRNAQLAVEEVYRNCQTAEGNKAIADLARLGLAFGEALEKGDMQACASIVSENWGAQKRLASASTTPLIDEMYDYAMHHGAEGGKLCGAGGGGAFLFFSTHPDELKRSLKQQFSNCFEIDFEFELKSIKELNVL